MALMDKLNQGKLALSLMTKFQPILKHVISIKGSQTHGEQELIVADGKSFAIYREIFESELDAEHFIKFCNMIYKMKPDQLPPIHILIVMFKAMYPIMTPKELKGKQSHGKPETRKLDDGKFMVILKEVFTEKDDAQSHLEEATKIKSMKL